MKTSNFFKKKNIFLIQELFPKIKFIKKNKINNIKTLNKSSNADLTFFDSIKYKSYAIDTKAYYNRKIEKISTQNYRNNYCKKRTI